jgi:hypothetical protein
LAGLERQLGSAALLPEAEELISLDDSETNENGDVHLGASRTARRS